MDIIPYRPGLDKAISPHYNKENLIGQFVTILSVNKTRETGWALCAHFCLLKNLFFDRQAEVNKAVKTSNATPKCMWILEWGALRSKSKSLA